jgi:hypothetical protein
VFFGGGNAEDRVGVEESAQEDQGVGSGANSLGLNMVSGDRWEIFLLGFFPTQLCGIPSQVKNKLFQAVKLFGTPGKSLS